MEPLLETINFKNPCPGQANGMPAYYFLQAMHMLLASHCTLGDPHDYPKDFGDRLTNNDTFDFIIVGGGSAGSVIANRLTEIAKWKILLIEAGGSPTFESDIPQFFLSLPKSKLDWNFEIGGGGKNCLGMVNETCSLFQGKVLGGSSTINKMHYFRGNRFDYEDWANSGNKDWNYEKVLKKFKKSEKLDGGFELMEDPEEAFEKLKRLKEKNNWEFYQSSKLAAKKYHSKGGIMGIDHFSYDYSLAHLKKKLCESAEEIGIPHLADANGMSQIGCVQAMAAINEGARGNSAKNFLSPIKERKNLFVARNATVEKLILDGKIVRGVKFSMMEKVISVFASEEVILSAGAINSPRLLLLSGIGPKKDLESIGIEVVHDLPGVGENLQMQISFFGLPFAIGREKIKPFGQTEKIDAMYQFVSRGTGPFGSVGLTDLVVFANTKKNGSLPDIQLLHYLNRPGDYYTFNELLISLRIKNEIRDQFARAYSKSNILLICPTLLKPESRGKVELIGPEFELSPKITYDFLGNEEDLRTLIRGIKLAIELTETNSFREFEANLLSLDVGGCGKDSSKFKSDQYWECLIRHLASGMHDASGTCKMGPPQDVFAVVDEELKVRGVKGLRVADSSVMPTMVRGSTSIAAVMIGEMVSDLIKAGRRRKKTKNDEL